MCEMASNPLFSFFRGKKFSYGLQLKDPQKNLIKLTKFSKMDKPPASKKRRVENDELWGDDDDDFELTQKDLENIDCEVMASQSTKNGTTTHHPSVGASNPGPSGSALSAEPGRLTGRSTSSSFLKPRPVNNSSSSSSSTSPHPASLSTSSGSRSGSSLCSNNSEYIEIPTAPGSRRSSASFSIDCKDQSLTTAFLRDPVVEGEIKKYKEQCNNLKEELQIAKEDRYSNEGRLKILQDNLAKKESELSELKQERAKYLDQQKREQTDKEKTLQSEVNKLTTQLQFKDRELDNFRDRCRTLETQSAKAGTSPAVHSPIMSSPKVKRKKMEDKSPKGKSSFPTSQSFLAEDIPHHPSTSRTTYKPVETKDEGTMASIHSKNEQQSVKSRHFNLTLRCPKGSVSGVELLADLLDADLSAEMSGEEKGIVGLLQKQTSVVDLQSLQFDRDSSSLLSPIPNKRALELKHEESSSVSPEKSSRKSIISPDSYASAIHGMKCLLRNQQTFQSRTESKVMATDTTLNGAILFLPMIHDYLTQYMDMLTSNLDARTCSSPQNLLTSSGSSKSSFDSSVESLTSSLDMLLKDSADYANNLENMTLVTLQIVHKLVSFSSVIRNILLNVDSGTKLVEESTEEGEKLMETDGSSPTSSISEDSDWSMNSQKIIDLQLLRKIIKTADCGLSRQKEKWYNHLIVEKCFDILIVLGTHASDDQLERLKPENIGRILVNALECRTDKQMVIIALYLISTLVQYNKVVSSLCICPEGCILLTIYQTCTELIETEDNATILIVGKVVLEILMSIQSVHKGGIVLLLESDCNCRLKVVQTIVLLVHKMLKIYENTFNKDIIQILTKGLLLLHMMSQRQYDFADKHYLVEHQYVKFVCGLTKVIKDLPDNYEMELLALGDLWDFNQDDSELSQDSDEDSQPG